MSRLFACALVAALVVATTSTTLAEAQKVRAVCTNLFVYENTGATATSLRWDTRPRALTGREQLPRWPVTAASVAPGATFVVPTHRHGASRETLYVWDDEDVGGHAWRNEREGSRCVRVSPVCRGTFAVESLVDETLEFAWSTPVYTLVGSTPSVSQEVLLAPRARVLVTTRGEHAREKLYVYLTRGTPGDENKSVEERTAWLFDIVQARHRPCETIV